MLLNKIIIILFKSTKVNKYEIIQADSLRKQKTFHDSTNGFPVKWRTRNERRNSVLMTHYYPDPGTASDWLCCVISMEFLHSFLRCHFAGKPLVALQNVVCFLRLRGQWVHLGWGPDFTWPKLRLLGPYNTFSLFSLLFFLLLEFYFVQASYDSFHQVHAKWTRNKMTVFLLCKEWQRIKNNDYYNSQNSVKQPPEAYDIY